VTGGKILAYILGHDVHVVDNHLKPSQDEPDNRIDVLDVAVRGLFTLLGMATYGGPIANAATCATAMRAALALYGMDQRETAIATLSLITSDDRAKNALLAVVRDHFKTPNWMPEEF